MVAPLIAAAARAAAKGAAKGAARKSTKAGASSGVRTKGDELYNARKRFTRQAERYAKKARNESGTLADKYRTLARIELNNALNTYESTPKAKKVVELMQELGVSRQDYDKPSDVRREYLTERSLKSLEESRRTPEARRDFEAQSILSSNIGKRIYAGLTSIWAKEQGGKLKQNVPDINEAIMKKFGVSSMADVLDIIAAQVDLYAADDEKLERYDELRSAIELAFA